MSTVRDQLEYHHIKDLIRGEDGAPVPAPLPPRGSKESLFMEAELGLNGVNEKDLQTQMGDLVPVASLKQWIKNSLTNKIASEKTALAAANISMKLIQEITRLEVAKINKRNEGAIRAGMGRRAATLVESNLTPPPSLPQAITHPSEFSFPPLPPPPPLPAASSSNTRITLPAAPTLPANHRVQKPVEQGPSSEPS